LFSGTAAENAPMPEGIIKINTTITAKPTVTPLMFLRSDFLPDTCLDFFVASLCLIMFTKYIIRPPPSIAYAGAAVILNLAASKLMKIENMANIITSSTPSFFSLRKR